MNLRTRASGVVSQQLFLIALFGIGIGARFQSLLPGFALDDYVHVSETGAGTYALLASQGRWGSTALFVLLDSLSIPLSSTYVLGSILLTFGLAYLFSLVIQLMKFGYSWGNLGISAIALCSTYQTEIFTFRSAVLNVAVAVSLMVFAILTVTRDNLRPARSWFISAALVFTALSFYQSILNYLVIISLMGLVISRASLRSTFSGLSKEWQSRLLLATAVGTICYLTATKTLQALQGVQADQRSQLLASSDLLERFLDWLRLLGQVYYADEPIVPQALKATMFLLFLAGLTRILLSKRLPKTNRASLDFVWRLSQLVLIVALMTPGLILVFESWWPVPRVIAHLSVGLAIIAMFVSQKLGVKNHSYGLFILSLLLIATVLKTQSIFVDQGKLNDSDKALASSIAQRVNEVAGPDLHPTVTIVGGFYKIAGSEITTNQGDLNMSAFGADFSKYPLVFSQIQLEPIEPSNDQLSAATAECKKKAPWPSKAAVFKLEEQIIVCLSKP